MNSTHIPEHLRTKVQRELDPSEEVTLMGMPVPSYFTPRSITLLLFSIRLTCMADFWTWIGIELYRSKIPTAESFLSWAFFLLLCATFILSALWTLSSPVRNYRRARATVHAVTNQRLISISGTKRVTVRSVTPEGIQDLHRIERPNNLGDVILSSKIVKDPDGRDGRRPYGFYNIPNPREAEEQIRALQS